MIPLEGLNLGITSSHIMYKTQWDLHSRNMKRAKIKSI